MDLIALIGFMAGNAEPLSSISSFATATSTAITIDWPGGLQAGDVAVLYDRANAAVGTPTAVIPSGFTQIITESPGTITGRQTLSYKVLTGSESGSITGQDATTKRKMLHIIRGNIPITSVTVNSLLSEGTSGNPASQLCLSGAGAAPLIVYGAYGVSGGVQISPRTFTPSPDAEITAGIESYFNYKIYNSSPANITVDMDDEGTNNILQSFFLTFNQ